MLLPSISCHHLTRLLGCIYVNWCKLYKSPTQDVCLHASTNERTNECVQRLGCGGLGKGAAELRRVRVGAVQIRGDEANLDLGRQCRISRNIIRSIASKPMFSAMPNIPHAKSTKVVKSFGRDARRTNCDELCAPYSKSTCPDALQLYEYLEVNAAKESVMAQ